jgi:hypothetical protein
LCVPSIPGPDMSPLRRATIDKTELNSARHHLGCPGFTARWACARTSSAFWRASRSARMACATCIRALVAATTLKQTIRASTAHAVRASALHLRFDRLSCSMAKRRSSGSVMAGLRSVQPSTARRHGPHSTIPADAAAGGASNR